MVVEGDAEIDKHGQLNLVKTHHLLSKVTTPVCGPVFEHALDVIMTWSITDTHEVNNTYWPTNVAACVC